MRRALLAPLLATLLVSTLSVARASDFEEGVFRSSAPDEARQLVDRALAGLELPPPPRDAFDLRRAQALARRTLEETLAAEGWFTPVIRVDDLEATLAAVEAAGGTVTVPIFAFPGGRRFHFRDVDGHELAAMQAD